MSRIIIIAILLFVLLGCKQESQGDDFQYLGNLHELKWNCDAPWRYTTTLKTRGVLSITVIGKVELHGLGSIYEFSVWLNMNDKILRLTKDSVKADYHVINVKLGNYYVR